MNECGASGSAFQTTAVTTAGSREIAAAAVVVLIAEMAISESFGGEFRRSVESWGERRERNRL